MPSIPSKDWSITETVQHLKHISFTKIPTHPCRLLTRKCCVPRQCPYHLNPGRFGWLSTLLFKCVSLIDIISALSKWEIIFWRITLLLSVHPLTFQCSIHNSDLNWWGWCDSYWGARVSAVTRGVCWPWLDACGRSRGTRRPLPVNRNWRVRWKWSRSVWKLSRRSRSVWPSADRI